MYKSKTTSGFDMKFESFIVEAICLNMDTKLRPYFWRANSSNKYWKNKFQREISIGIKRLKQQINPFQTGNQESLLIQAIRYTDIKTLLGQKNIDKVCRRYTKELELSRVKKEQLSTDNITTIDQKEYMQRNATQSNSRNKLLEEDENI